MVMKESDSDTFCDSKSYEKEPDLFLCVKEGYKSDDFQKDTDRIRFEVNNKDDDGGMVESPTKEIPIGILQLESPLKDADSLSSETIYREISRSSSAQEVSVVDKLVDCLESKSEDYSGTPIIVSDMSETKTKTDSEQNVIEQQSCELSVRVGEINCQSVKDVCIDEVMPVKDKFLSGSSEDGQPVVSRSDIRHENCCFHDEGDAENKYIETNGFGQDECHYKEVCNDDDTDKFMQKSAVDSSVDKNGDTESYDRETKPGANFSEDKSFAERELSIQENSAMTSLASLFKSFDGEEDESFEPHDQTVGTLVSSVPHRYLVGVETLKDHQEHELDNSKSEKSPDCCDNPSTSGIKNGKIEVVREQQVKSRDEDVCTDGDVMENTAVAVIEPSLGSGSKDTRAGNTLAGSIDHSNDLSATGKPSLAGTKNQTLTNNARNSDESSITSSLLHHGDGDSSFSAAGHITYSGPIAFSGSLSIRSDASTTSGKSFAFPILQSEWNSSPVRMAKGNRRRFWKQKTWKSRLCCRF